MKTSTKMRKKITDRFALWLLALLLLASSVPGAAAQQKKQPEPYALIFGTVFDQDGRAVHGVPIRVQRVGDKRPRWKLLSDRRGEFAQRVPAGKAEYIVWAELKRKKRDSRPLPQVRVAVENDERKDISLHLNQ